MQPIKWKFKLFVSIVLVLIFSVSSWTYDKAGEGIISGKAGALQAEDSDVAYAASKLITNTSIIRSSLNWGIALLFICLWFRPAYSFVKWQINEYEKF